MVVLLCLCLWVCLRQLLGRLCPLLLPQCQELQLLLRRQLTL